MGVEGEGQRHAEDMKPPESGITVCNEENIHLGGFSSQYLNKLDAITHIADFKILPENKISYMFHRNYFDAEKIYFGVEETEM